MSILCLCFVCSFIISQKYVKWGRTHKLNNVKLIYKKWVDTCLLHVILVISDLPYVKKIFRFQLGNLKILIIVSLTQMIEISHFICRGRGSNPEHITSPQFNCVSSNRQATWPKKNEDSLVSDLNEFWPYKIDDMTGVNRNSLKLHGWKYLKFCNLMTWRSKTKESSNCRVEI